MNSENNINNLHHPSEETPKAIGKENPTLQLCLGALFGIIFGFLLQKGGVAKYDLLVGVLLLEDFTVIKVMLSAIVVGMIGIFYMNALGIVQLHIKPTRYGANIIGGLIFGVGFALAGYCPGTSAAAIGQGNFDALYVALGMIVGAYLYAELSGWLSNTVETWGNRGELTLPQVVHLPRKTFIVVFQIVLISFLVFLYFSTQ